MSTENAIEALGIDFWRWRTLQQPRSHDDIPRIERNKNWKPAWSSQDVAGYQNAISDFQKRWKAIDAGTVNSLKVSKESWVDYQLIGSAIHRVYWELDYLKVWQQQPRFYIDQTAGVVFDLLLPIQVNDEIVRDVVFALNFTEEILSSGIKNLANNAVKAYAVVAIDLLKDIENQLNTMSKELAEFVDQDLADALEASTKKAIGAFVNYREWLISNLDSFKPISAIGKDNYEWFFKKVALVPFTTHELNMIGELEWDRAVVLEQISLNKHKKIAIPAIPSSAAEQVKNEANDERQVRQFYAEQGILSQPQTLKHYLNAPLPAYLAPIKWLGVTDDLTGPSRVDEDGYSYVPEPHNKLPYFYAANARDARAGIVHEGAHYQQLAISWRHERVLRRYYYDSGVNEGIAFYNEELLLAAGLFDDKVHSQTVMYNFMKLRAMRVIVDVGLATGRLDIASATAYLEKKVPMDHETAYEEAVFFSSSPGQALTYQIGKTQILKLFSDVVSDKKAKSEAFNMQEFHDYLWKNGNVPLSLLRFEFLGDASEIGSILKNA
ncbi:hypothetical protein GM51_3680 [freshwater metagenome]|uniref:DUF885 domain-containing protein n=1 Tax=freshwater metagenome TaxID=449393 RepID=A0A094SQZ9_9ZZZZ